MDNTTKVLMVQLASRIRDFSALCEAEEYTDTGDAWELLNEALELLESAGD